MEILARAGGAAVVVYVAVCFGTIAARHGKNPVFYGILSVFCPFNLIALGYWAFASRPPRGRS